jgi:uncharacterized protein (TIGR03663 family)
MRQPVPSLSREPVGIDSPVISQRNWWISVILILLVAAVLRMYDLPLVPLHHDEGVNGNFLVRLVRENVYRYDPQNYHGPTIYYLTAFIYWIIKALFGPSAAERFGLNTITIRLVPALFGLGTVALIFCLRRWLGTIATLSAALLLALSPGAVYLSRYFIHETLFVFFTLGIVVGALFFYDKRNPIYLLLTGASLAMLFATKETAMISAAVLVIAFACTQIYLRLLGPRQPPVKVKGKIKRQSAYAQFVADLGGTSNLAVWLFVAFVIFVSINILFYSSFFSNYPQGVLDSLKTFSFWSKTGAKEHVHPPLTYFRWLFNQESPLLFLGLLGAALAVLKPRNLFALFCGLWAFGLIAAYSLLPYKTPWLILNFLLPLALISGYAVQMIYELSEKKAWVPAVILLGAVLISSYKTIDLNFFNYDNDDSYYVYVYAHTTRGTLRLVNQIDQIAGKQADKTATGVTIVSPDYWPLPWYLRNYTRVGYYGQMAPSNEPMIIANENQKAEMEANFSQYYQQVNSGIGDGSFDLRPGVKLLLYERKDIIGN